MDGWTGPLHPEAGPPSDKSVREVEGLANSAIRGFGAVTIMRIRVAAIFRRDRSSIMSDTSRLEPRFFMFLEVSCSACSS